jgi:hypothetical protein
MLEMVNLVSVEHYRGVGQLARFICAMSLERTTPMSARLMLSIEIR